jgi:hypothetical protein
VFDAHTIVLFFYLFIKLPIREQYGIPGENKEKDHENYLSEKIDLSAGTGDAPDDWYVVYANKETHLIEKKVGLHCDLQRKAKKKTPHAIHT